MSDLHEMIDALSDGNANGSPGSSDEQQGATEVLHLVVTDEPHPVGGGRNDGASKTSHKGSLRSYTGSHKGNFTVTAEELKKFRLFLQQQESNEDSSDSSSVSSLSTSDSPRRKPVRRINRRNEAARESATTPTKQKPAAAEESPTGAADNAIKEDAGETGQRWRTRASSRNGATRWRSRRTSRTHGASRYRLRPRN